MATGTDFAQLMISILELPVTTMEFTLHMKAGEYPEVVCKYIPDVQGMDIQAIMRKTLDIKVIAENVNHNSPALKLKPYIGGLILPATIRELPNGNRRN